MRKNIFFYLIWDIIVYLVMYLYINISDYLMNIYRRSFVPLYQISIMLGYFLFSLFIGIAISILLLYGVKHIKSKIMALIEFIIVGLFSVYLGNIYLLALVNAEALIPNWMMQSYELLMVTGNIIFGVELTLFIKRMIAKYE